MVILTNADFLIRFDYRLISQQLSDTNVPISQANLLVSTQLSDIINDAEGVVLAALYVAYKYDSTKIAALADESLGLVKRIIADIAFIYCCGRRGYDYREKMPLVQDSYDILNLLRSGERVLNFEDNEDAGNTQVATVSVVNQQVAGLVSTSFRYFPMPVNF
jgi:hypothetical protein